MKLHLSIKNILIAKNFDFSEKNKEFSKEPILIKLWEDTDLWYIKDYYFDRP